MGPGLYFGLGGEGGMFTPMEAAAFAALIVAVDPVAILSVFRSVGADARLHALIFGESVLNDAMAIVLFKTVVSLGTKTTIGIEGWHEFGVDDFFAIVGAFCLIFVGSIAVGIIAGLALAMSLKFLRLFELQNAAGAELILLVCASYSQFILAEICGLSGIVSTLFCGATAVIYASRNLSPSARELTEFSAALLARFTEIIIFILIGFGFCLYTFAERQTHEIRDALLQANPQVESCDPDAGGSHLGAAFVGLTLLLCLVSRACAIFPLAGVVNACRSAHKRIAFKEQAVIWFSGLRGAIALALAVEFPQLPSTLGEEGEGNFCFQRDAVVACTIIVILSTVFVCGGLTRPMLWACGIQTGVVQSHRDHQGHVAATAAQDGAAQDGAAQDGAFQSKSRWKRALWRLDVLYIRPRVIHDYVGPEGARARPVLRTAAEHAREGSAFTPKRGFSPCKTLHKSFKGAGQEGLIVPGTQNTELSVVSAALGDSSDAATAI
uniref:Cation/H+ exchanger transmembrane domain-containing protein n=1 Tax=Chrysotila carterae TaxID=13221 RepID=A0A7S4AZ58_CHRCT